MFQLRPKCGKFDVKIKYISTNKQIADIFTKPVDAHNFFTLRKM